MIALLLILVPLLGAVAVAVAPPARAKWIATGITMVSVLLGIVAAASFGHWRDGGFGLSFHLAWMPELGIGFSLHADAVSLLLVLLTILLMPICVIASFTAVNERLREYYGWLLALQAAMTGVFLARDLVLFYICFEFTLVPMYFLIAIFGGANRAKAAVKFFLYTFTGSLMTLSGLLYIAYRFSEVNGGWSFDIAELTGFAVGGLSVTEQAWLLLAMMAGFAVKVPLFPVHTWLPLAHTEAPTAGSVILAGVLLKLGTYGLYRFVLPMLPEAVVQYAPLIAVFAIIGILYGALICWVQTDVKKLVAYSSVSHLGFCVLGLFALNPMGLQGSVLYMINHGLSTGALFLLIGMMYERYHTRDMNRIGGLARRMPIWSFFMVFFVLSSVGLPGLNGFVSELLCLIAAFTATPDSRFGPPGVLGPWYAAFAGIGMILAAMYLLIMTGRVVFGPLREPGGHDDHDSSGLSPDIGTREVGVLLPLAVLCVVLGVRPGLVTDAIERPIDLTLAGYAERIVPPVTAELPAAEARMETRLVVTEDGRG